MQKVVSVKFKDDGKSFYFSPSQDNLEVGDKVIVETINGKDLATVCTGIAEMEDSVLVLPLKKIIRKANDKDIKEFESKRATIEEMTKTIEQKVQELKLEMKIVNVSINSQDNKIVVEFVSDGRIDFRELLKQLAYNLKSRIELKQIGQRDEVKVKGGLGPCGQICCCNRFLKEFEHVSIKMAKNQGLALNPNKISGLCGKLLCCLAYENNVYVEAMKHLPKINSEVVTPSGKGKVLYNDILKQMITVKMFDDDNTINVFPVADLKFDKPKDKSEEGEE